MQAHSARLNEDDCYTILNLPKPRATGSQNVSQDEVKAAYRRALLLHHPDKMQPHMVKGHPDQKDTVTAQKAYSVDQIVRAYQTLIDPLQRDSYNKAILTTSSGKLPNSSDVGGHLGVESFDLEDLEYHEEQSIWSKACRCGSDAGYILTEAELEKESGEGEVYVGCQGCSLVIKVLFSVEEESTSS